MSHAERSAAEVLVLRAWIEGHQSPLRVRVVRFDTIRGERGSTIVHRRDDVLALVASWLDELSAGGGDGPDRC
jgi:hypothetical protein